MVPKKSQFSPKVPNFAFVELFWGRSQIPNPVLECLIIHSSEKKRLLPTTSPSSAWLEFRTLVTSVFEPFPDIPQHQNWTMTMENNCLTIPPLAIAGVLLFLARQFNNFIIININTVRCSQNRLWQISYHLNPIPHRGEYFSPKLIFLHIA